MTKTVTMKAVHSLKFPGRIIPAGAMFACPEEHVKALEASGAITKPKDLIAAEVGAEAPPSAPISAEPETPTPAPAAPAAAATLSPEDALTAARAEAENLGIKVRKNWKLATLENKIKAFEEDGIL